MAKVLMTRSLWDNIIRNFAEKGKEIYHEPSESIHDPR
jgi:hypothetical protein